MSVQPSGIRAVFERASELEAGGRSVVHMEIGRPHLQSPKVAKDAALDALERGAVHYTANRGIPELRAAIAADLERGGRPAYDPESEIVVTAGGSEAVAATMLALLGPGDEVVILDPAWPHYDAHARLAGAVPVHVPCEPSDGFMPDPDRVAAAVGAQTRLLVVSSPCNPSGAVFAAERLAALADISLSNGLVVISDEIYERFVHGQSRHRSIAAVHGMRDRTVVANSFSKTYSMTGWRVGYAAAPAELAGRINTVHQYLSVCAPSFAQAGAVAALEHGEPFVQEMVAEYSARRRTLIGGLADLDAVDLLDPAGAFYAFARIPGADAGNLAVRLLEEQGVAVVPGEVFGVGFEDHIRLSYAISEQALAEGMTRIHAFLD